MSGTLECGRTFEGGRVDWTSLGLLYSRQREIKPSPPPLHIVQDPADSYRSYSHPICPHQQLQANHRHVYPSRSRDGCTTSTVSSERPAVRRDLRLSLHLCHLGNGINLHRTRPYAVARQGSAATFSRRSTRGMLRVSRPTIPLPLCPRLLAGHLALGVLRPSLHWNQLMLRYGTWRLLGRSLL